MLSDGELVKEGEEGSRSRPFYSRTAGVIPADAASNFARQLALGSREHVHYGVEASYNNKFITMYVNLHNNENIICYNINHKHSLTYIYTLIIEYFIVSP